MDKKILQIWNCLFEEQKKKSFRFDACIQNVCSFWTRSVFCAADLVPKETVEAWMECLQKELPVVAFKASARIQDRTEVSGAF